MILFSSSLSLHLLRLSQEYNTKSFLSYMFILNHRGERGEKKKKEGEGPRHKNKRFKNIYLISHILPFASSSTYRFVYARFHQSYCADLKVVFPKLFFPSLSSVHSYFIYKYDDSMILIELGLSFFASSSWAVFSSNKHVRLRSVREWRRLCRWLLVKAFCGAFYKPKALLICLFD